MTGQIVAQARGGETKSPPVKPVRPRFSTAWQAYPVGTTAEEAYAEVGGQAYEHYKYGKENPPNPYANACAIRLSRAFNYAGLEIKSGSAVAGKRLKGGDGKAYFFRVDDMRNFIKTQFGKADLTILGGSDNAKNQLLGKKGILFFSVTGWRGATGHATLWDGSKCGDDCYFEHEDLRVKTTKIEFWELKDD